MGKRLLAQAYAYVMPLPDTVIQRVLHEGRTVILKYLGWPSMAGRFRRDTIIILYQTHSERLLVGEVRVKTAELMRLSGAKELYGNSIAIDEEELADYVRLRSDRSGKDVLAIVIKDPSRYESIIKWKTNLTPVGAFLSSEDYHQAIR